MTYPSLIRHTPITWLFFGSEQMIPASVVNAACITNYKHCWPHCLQFMLQLPLCAGGKQANIWAIWLGLLKCSSYLLWLSLWSSFHLTELDITYHISLYMHILCVGVQKLSIIGEQGYTNILAKIYNSNANWQQFAMAKYCTWSSLCLHVPEMNLFNINICPSEFIASCV